MFSFILASFAFTVGYLVGSSSRDSRESVRLRLAKADSSWLNKKL